MLQTSVPTPGGDYLKPGDVLVSPAVSSKLTVISINSNNMVHFKWNADDERRCLSVMAFDKSWRVQPPERKRMPRQEIHNIFECSRCDATETVIGIIELGCMPSGWGQVAIAMNGDNKFGQVFLAPDEDRDFCPACLQAIREATRAEPIKRRKFNLD